MSRHRLVRNMTEDDYDDYRDDVITDKQDEQLQKAMEKVKEVISGAADDYDIEESLYYYNMNVEKTVQWLLEGVDPDEHKGVQTTTKQTRITDNQPKKRPILNNTATITPASQKNQSSTTTTRSTLLGSRLSNLLAAKPSTGANVNLKAPSLANPAILLQPTTKTIASPLLSMLSASSHSPQPLLLTKSGAHSTNSLLASLMRKGNSDDTISTALSALQLDKSKEQQPTKVTVLNQTSIVPLPLSVAVTPVTTTQIALIAPTKTLVEIMDRSPISIESEEDSSQVRSAPSCMAALICTPSQKNHSQQDTLWHNTLSSIKYPNYLYPLSASSDIKPFKFDSPSPDDIVTQARSTRGDVATPVPTVKSTKSSKATAKLAATSLNLKSSQSLDKVIVRGQSQNDIDRLSFDVNALGLTANIVLPTRENSETDLNIDKTLSSDGDMTTEITTSLASQQSISPPRKSTKKLDLRTEYEKRNQQKDTLNLVVVGHVDAGKSTLMGHLLFKLGEVNDKTMQKYERDAQKQGKGSFAYAWVLDETPEERSRGITIDVAVARFETEHHKFTLLDAPGHRDFIPNMISGAAQADVAVLVVDATHGEFEAGFDQNGQTKEHALLVRSLGLSQLVVAINKLDSSSWSQTRYDEIVQKLTPFLVNAGFRRQKVYYVPTSGLSGENLIKRTDKTLEQWYQGPTLVKQLDALDVPERLIDRPFRMSITDFFKGGIQGGSVSITGRIESGGVQIGDQIVFMPIGEQGVLRAVSVNDQPEHWAAAGDQVVLSIQGLDPMQLSVGDVLCAPSTLIPVTSHIRAKIVVFDIKVPITLGFPVIFHHQSHSETGHISNLVAVLDKASGEITKKNPRCITKHTTATVEVILAKPVCLDTFTVSKELGRFMLRKAGETIAAGIVTDILEYYQPSSIRSENKQMIQHDDRK